MASNRGPRAFAPIPVKQRRKTQEDAVEHVEHRETPLAAGTRLATRGRAFFSLLTANRRGPPFPEDTQPAGGGASPPAFQQHRLGSSSRVFQQHGLGSRRQQHIRTPSPLSSLPSGGGWFGYLPRKRGYPCDHPTTPLSCPDPRPNRTRRDPDPLLSFLPPGGGRPTGRPGSRRPFPITIGAKGRTPIPRRRERGRGGVRGGTLGPKEASLFPPPSAPRAFVREGSPAILPVVSGGLRASSRRGIIRLWLALGQPGQGEAR